MRGGALQRICAALAVMAALAAQEKLEVEGPQPGVVRLGDSATVRITIEGRGADPRTPQIPQVEGLTTQLSGPSHSSYTFFDGRTQIQRSGVQYTLLLRPQQQGEVVVPSFPIWTGTKEQRTPELRLRVVKDLRGGDLAWIDVTVEPQRVYVHEPIRIRTEFGIQPGLRLVQDVYQRTRYLDVEVQASWLSRFPGGERIALPEPTGDLRAIISNRELFAAEFDGKHLRDGKTWQRFGFDRAFLPTRTGKIELMAPTLRFHVVRSAGVPDVFGRPRGSQSENLYVYGKAVTVEVLPIPEAGRPTPYYGAVGRFAIRAELDRDSVVVGSSIKLQLVVTGTGNLEFLRLPECDDLEGFHKLGAAEVRRDAQKVVVSYDLAPLSADVDAVPALPWNYFDTSPGVERFVEVATRPLPLDVKPLANGEMLAPLPEAARKAVTPGVDDIYDLPELEGAPRRRAAAAGWWSWLVVLGPWLLGTVAGYAFAAWRRRAADTAGQRLRSARRTCRAAIAAGTDPIDALAGYLGDRFDVPAAAVIRPDLQARLELAGVDAELAGELAGAIERGTAARYGGGEPLTADDVAALVARLDPVALRRGAWLGWLLLPMLLGAPATAQQDGVAAYRNGDYVAAEAAFVRRYQATGDRRLLQARGNCLFRRGDLPRALWAYESALLGAPRDAQLLANVAVVRSRLEIPPPEVGFVGELAQLQRRLLPAERRALLLLCMFVAALCLVTGWRRVGLRWVGAIALMPGLWLAAEEVWLGPSRRPVAIALTAIAITSEPRADLDAVATVRPGVAVDVLGSTQGAFVRVSAAGRSGYVPTAAIAVVE